MGMNKIVFISSSLIYKDIQIIYRFIEYITQVTTYKTYNNVVMFYLISQE